MKPTPNGQDSRKNLDETRKKTKNPRKTRPNNTPQDPLGSQEGITLLFHLILVAHPSLHFLLIIKRFERFNEANWDDVYHVQIV